MTILETIKFLDAHELRDAINAMLAHESAQGQVVYVMARTPDTHRNTTFGCADLVTYKLTDGSDVLNIYLS